MKKFVLKDLYGKPLLAVESDHYDKAVKYFSIIKINWYSRWRCIVKLH